jgi:hypothetical protein
MTGIVLAFHPKGPKLEVIKGSADPGGPLDLASEADPKEL